MAWCLIFAAAAGMAVNAFADTSSASVLGLEPGDRRLNNDDIGVILWGPDTAPTLSIGKSDIWDRRNPQPPQPILTLEEIKRLAMTGDPRILNGAAYYTAYNSHDFPCPKPAGQLILRMPFLEAGGALSVEEAGKSLVLHARQGERSLRIKIFVSASRNVIVLDGLASNLEPGDLSVRLYRHRDSILPGDLLHPTLGDQKSPLDFEPLPMPRAGFETDCFWIQQDFPPEMTFPEGFSTLLAARISGVQSAMEAQEGKTDLGTPMRTDKEGRLTHMINKRFSPINASPGSAAEALLGAADGPFAVFAAVVTTQDARDPLAKARRDLDEAFQLGAEGLWRENVQRFAEYESRPRARAWSSGGFIQIDKVWGGNPYRARPSGYYGDIPFCSVDSTKFCFQDSSPWHADFHFNEISALESCVLRQFHFMDPYFRLILTLLPMAQANARQVYNARGAMYPLIHYPLKAETVIHSHVTWEQSMEITALLAKPFWLRYQYSGDRDFLRDMAYPVLREGARFYADFLRREKDGLYHVFPTVSPEHRGITRNLEFNRDSQSGITLIRYHLRAAAEAARLCGLDLEEAARWREIASRMPEYPTVDTPEGPIFIDVAGAKPMEYNIAVPLSAVFWGDDISLDSPPALLETARRTLRLIQVWEPHRFYLRGVRIRLGIYHPDDPMGTENLLQSHTGVIRVFPTVPDDFVGGFENFGTQGAFAVSAERTKNGVAFIRLTSLAGNECRVANPWPDQPVILKDETTGAEFRFPNGKGPFRFETTTNHTYRLQAR